MRDAVRCRHEMSATLNRSDNLRLLLELSGLTLNDFTVGSRAGYRPTLRGPACVAVGDATATLPFECALEFGRIGLTEAQIQSGLYRSWTGLIVSRQRIQQSEGGTIEYLKRYLAARRGEDPAMLATLFTDHELRRLAAAGSDLMEVTAPLDQGSFGIGTDGITVLAALCTDLDPWLADTGGILASPRWRAGKSELEVDALVVSGGTADRRILAAAPLQDTGLPTALRQWYRTFDWRAVEDQSASSEPRLAGIGEIAEGRNVRAAAGDVEVVSQKEI